MSRVREPRWWAAARSGRRDGTVGDRVAVAVRLRWATLEHRSSQLTERLLAGLRAAPYVRKWLVLGALIGIVAGLGAAAFITALHLGDHYLLGALGGHVVPGVAGEGGTHPASGFPRPWAVVLVVAAGGLLSGLLVFEFAPKAEGHGTDAAIAAVHHNPRAVRAHVTAVKFVASAITIGSGGSGGREGPTAQISAGFGSIIARKLNLSMSDARIAVSTGIASGIASIFRAPLGGALLGVELPYRNDVEIEALLPSLVASIVGFAVYGSIEGFEPIFGYHTSFHFTHIQDLWMFALLGLVAGGIGRLYAVGFYGLSDVLHKVPLPKAVRPAVAGLFVGALGLVVPGVLGTGYGALQESFARTVLLSLPFWVVVALPFAKILATGLSIGSGGSGGIFGPGMVIGGFAGAALWRVLQSWVPGVPVSPVPFVIVGMMACFGAVAHAPIAVMLMVAEMTGNLSLLAPGMVAVALALLVVGDTTIYREQLGTRADSPAHRFQFGLPLVATIPVTDVMSVPRLVLPADLTVSAAADRLAAAGVPGAPVVAGDGGYLGSVQAAALGVPDGSAATAGAATAAAATAGAATLDAATAGPVVTPAGRVDTTDGPEPGGPGGRAALPPGTALPTGRDGPALLGRTVATVADLTAATVASDATLAAAIEALTSSGAAWVPVLDTDRRVAGIVGPTELVRGYRLALRSELRQLHGGRRSAVLVEVEVRPGSPADGCTVEGLRLPPPAVVVSVLRRGSLLFADAATELRAGDVVSMIGRAGSEQQLRVAFGGDPIGAAEPTRPEPLV